MNKLLLIIQREYLTRVKRWSFIIATILTPLAFGLLFVVVGFIFSYESDDSKRIAILDEGNILEGRIKDENNLYFKFLYESIEELKPQFDSLPYNGILVIPKITNLYADEYRIYYYSNEQPTLDIETAIRSRVRRSIRDYKIEELKLDRKNLDALDISVTLDPEPIKETDEDASAITGAIGAGIGTIMGFIMYITVFVYGMMVMRSVMEEKTNRIVEVIISSVKPFQLMLGKIIGVGAVGLTQIAIWAILLPLISMLANLIFGFDAQTVDVSSAAAEIDPDDLQDQVALAIEELQKQNWWMIFPLFVVYFLGGYFLYASLFAAVGSAMGDDLGEGQSLTIPITIPVILALYIMLAAVRAPNSSLAVWSSIFPLFSPIVMPARLAFGPPLWEILLSVGLLVGGAIFFVWLSGRIYRIGILLYGKKITLKDIGRWLFSKY